VVKARSKPTDCDRLCSAIHSARKSMEWSRQRRSEMVKTYAGRWWSENTDRAPTYLNLLSVFVQIVSRNLISKNPRFALSTFARQDKPAVDQMQAWANDRVVEMELADSLRRVVYDAMFSVGIMKVALAHPGDAMQGGWNISAGTPFAERVSLDDFVYDVRARSFKEASLLGHRYKLPRDAAKARFGKKATDDLTDVGDDLYDEYGTERLDVLYRGHYGDSDSYEDTVAVWEIYDPRRRKIITLADSAVAGAGTTTNDSYGRGEPLWEQEWLGPDCGPYHFLGYQWVPDNAMPKGPVMDVIDLHNATNRLLRKQIRQADRQKSNLGVMTAAGNDAEKIRTANDGDIIPISHPDGLIPLDHGGPNAACFTLMLQLKELFSWAAGNLDIMGGLSPQSKTATQDKMLNENSSRSVADYQDTTVTFTASVGRALCWYWWKHPEIVMKSAYKPPGAPDDVFINRTLTPQRRGETSYSSMRVNVDPYSLVHQTPQAKLAAVNAVIQQTYAPLAQLFMQQGVSLDLNAYIDMAGEWMDLPELKDVIVYQEPPQPQGGAGQGSPGGEAPGMPASTNRTYTRENVSGTTTKGNDMAAALSMSGESAGGNPMTSGK
jgi:hypothetical protein